MMTESMFSGAMWSGHWLWMLILSGALVVPFWRICQRTGYPGWMGILILIPVINIVFLYFIAFMQWPAIDDHSQD